MDVQAKIKWGLDPELYCSHESVGKLAFDPLQGTKHYDPWWMLLVTDGEIQRLYGWFLKRYGIVAMPNKLWGPHVSIIKHEEPPDKTLWGGIDRDIVFRYTTNIRWDNGMHAWLDVYCPMLSEVRQQFGLPAKEWFHMTLGRIS